MINPGRFTNRYTRDLPGDAMAANSRRQVHGACYSRVKPTPVQAPRVLAVAHEVAELLELPESFVASPTFAAVFAGNQVLPGMDPHAMCYGGHQFGHWAGQLGDGRAIVLGEIATSRGDHFSLQLKGAGPTPYSRTADGLAVLRSSLREFLCSEAMHHLGVPTTRALSLITTGEEVIRDMFYDGRPRAEPGAVVCRVAPSFVRFGNFEILAARGEIDLLRQLLDFSLGADYPALGAPGRETYAAWLAEIARRTARMVAHWMRVGFVHGVMNTDNMSILGLTIDYGPYGWLEDYDPDWTPNTTDAAHRRYRFGTQPQVALWNLVQLANAIYPLVEDVPLLETALEEFHREYEAVWQAMLANKLGLEEFRAADQAEIVDPLYALLGQTETDMTLFFRHLAHPGLLPEATPEQQLGILSEAWYQPGNVSPATRQATLDWLRAYFARVATQEMPAVRRRQIMNATNPRFVPRNYLAQLAIDDAERGDVGRLHALMEVLRRPYDEQPERSELAAKRPDWARSRAGCSMLSCSS